MKILYAALLCLLMLVGTPFAQAAGTISVGLVADQFTAEISSDADFTVKTRAYGGGNSREFMFKAGKYYFNAANHRLNVEDMSFGDAVATVEGEGIKVNGREYRGRIEILLRRGGKNLVVRNVLPVEEYLYSVMGRTVPAYFPDEALKAQAVAMRTYALYTAQNGSDPDFDIRAGEKNFIYTGVDGEQRPLNKLIDATKGEVVTYGGSLIAAYTTLSSGGYTENSENVIGRYLPYLRSVKDFDGDAPDYNWERSFEAKDIAAGLQRGGYDCGKLGSIQLSDMDADAPDRSDTGRVLQLGFAGDKGSIIVPAAKAMELFGLPSTLFSIEVTRPIPDKLDVPIENYLGMEIGRKEIEIELKDKEKTETGIAKTIKLISGVDGEKVIFKGRGSGTGLGLSLWGARQLANDAGNAAGYYKQILRYYYRNTNVAKIY